MMFWNTGITRTNFNKLLLIIAVMMSAMILPSFEIRSSLPRVRLDDALIFGAAALNLCWKIIRRTNKADGMESSYYEGRSRGLSIVNKVFLLFLVSIIISNVYAGIFLGMPFGVRDAMEFVTLAKYYLAVTLALSLNLQEGEFALLKAAFLSALTIIMLLSWSQFLNFANVNTWLTPFFAPSHLNNLVNANPPRVLGTFDNPNVMGITSVICMTLFTTWFYFQKNERLKDVSLFIAIGLTIKLTFLTISRTAFLATAVVLTFLSIWAFFKHHWRKDIFFKVGCLFVLTLTIFFTSPRDFTARLDEATDIQTSTSVQGHILRAGDALVFIKESPILGWGTAKNIMMTQVDDEYALITRRYGVVGLAFYLWLFIRPALIAFRKGRALNPFVFEYGMHKDKALLGIAFAGSTLAIFVYNITAGVFYNLQLMTLIALFMGLIYRTEGESD